MSGAGLALLAGLVLPPVLLLWLGHGYRTRSYRARGVFWGGVVGYMVAAVAVSVAAMVPPLLWQEGGARALVVHGALLVVPSLGALLGWASRRPAR